VTGGTRPLEDRPLLHDHPTALKLSLVLWFIGGSLFLALAIPAIADVVQRFDDAVWELMVEWENDVAVAIAEAFDLIGSTPVTLPIIFGMAGYLVWRRRWEAFWFWALAMVSSQLLIGPVKGLYERERPPLPLVETSDFSFPSGHAVAGAAIAISLVIVLVPAGPKRRNLEMLAGAFAVLMALSRVYLRAHWFTDVAAGASLGVATAVLAAVIVHRIDERRADRAPDI
jgi:undecaprenyl-diphosphatase